jgi:galactose-1-phosphate uridylyltransferase
LKTLQYCHYQQTIININIAF